MEKLARNNQPAEQLDLFTVTSYEIKESWSYAQPIDIADAENSQARPKLIQSTVVDRPSSVAIQAVQDADKTAEQAMVLEKGGFIGRAAGRAGAGGVRWARPRRRSQGRGAQQAGRGRRVVAARGLHRRAGQVQGSLCAGSQSEDLLQLRARLPEPGSHDRGHRGVREVSG